MKFRDGRYIGEFKNGDFIGKNQHTFNDGANYIGDF
jgi:hypothetical protein